MFIFINKKSIFNKIQLTLLGVTDINKRKHELQQLLRKKIMINYLYPNIYKCLLYN